MNWWGELDGRVRPDAPLAPLTWYRLGGPAEVLYSPRDVPSLAAALRRTQEANRPLKILGGGANVLVGDAGFRGMVVQLDEPVFRECEFTEFGAVVGAGYDLMRLCNLTVEQGLSGLEFLAGIPGTVGGAVRMNAGGRYGSMEDVVRAVTVMTPDGEVQRWPRERIGFSYRHSNLGSPIVLSAEIELRPAPMKEVKDRYHEYWEYKKRSQPMADRTAGCVFKNPPDDSAGRLIETAGLKGLRIGGACVSPMHANFISANGGAKATDILRLIDTIRDRVRERFERELELEIDVW